MTRIPNEADMRRLFALIAKVNASGEPIAAHSANGRFIEMIEDNCVRDLRGLQFEREVRDAFNKAVSTDLWTTPDDTTRVFEEDATGMLLFVAIAELVTQIGSARAIEALAHIIGDLRGLRPDNLRETVLNYVDNAVHDM